MPSSKASKYLTKGTYYCQFRDDIGFDRIMPGRSAEDAAEMFVMYCLNLTTFRPSSSNVIVRVTDIDGNVKESSVKIEVNYECFAYPATIVEEQKES